MRRILLLSIIISTCTFVSNSPEQYIIADIDEIAYEDYEDMENFANRSNPKTGPSAITWKPNGGRFGDNLRSYSMAKLLSIRFGIPLLYFPFRYAEKLLLHENEDIYTKKEHQRFYATKQLIKLPPKLSKNNNTLYICHWETDIEIDWSDQEFIAELRKQIAPRYEIRKVIIPDCCISIAVHVRTGGTFAADTQQEKDRCPLRFVPNEFYIEQIDRIAQMFPEDNFYVHIFTDHPEPDKLVKKFAKKLNNSRIIFGCRHADNAHNANVLEDFFSMMDFDCLIRPGSHFTRFVQRLGNNKLVIYPESFKEINGKKVIDTINIKKRSNSNEKWKTKIVVIA